MIWDWLKGSGYQPTKAFESGGSHHKIKKGINGVSYPCCSAGWTCNSNVEAAAISHVRPSSIRLNNSAAHGCCLLLPMLQYSPAEADRTMSLVSIFKVICRRLTTNFGTMIVCVLVYVVFINERYIGCCVGIKLGIFLNHLQSLKEKVCVPSEACFESCPFHVSRVCGSFANVAQLC